MRRILFISLLALITVPLANAGDDVLPMATTAEVLNLTQQSDVARLSALFKTNDAVVVTESGMMIAETAPDTLLARVATDGSVSTACVTTPEAAANFLSPTRNVEPARPLQR